MKTTITVYATADFGFDGKVSYRLIGFDPTPYPAYYYAGGPYEIEVEVLEVKGSEALRAKYLMEKATMQESHDRKLAAIDSKIADLGDE